MIKFTQVPVYFIAGNKIGTSSLKMTKINKQMGKIQIIFLLVGELTRVSVCICELKTNKHKWDRNKPLKKIK